MTDGRGADLIGGWFGTGPQRGIALMFTLAGMIGVVVTDRPVLTVVPRLDAAFGGPAPPSRSPLLAGVILAEAA